MKHVIYQASLQDADESIEEEDVWISAVKGDYEDAEKLYILSYLQKHPKKMRCATEHLERTSQYMNNACRSSKEGRIDGKKIEEITFQNHA